MSVKKNYLFNVILSGVNVLYPLITFPYVARVLEPDGLGQAQFAFNFALYFSIVASFGIPFYGIKEIGKHRGNQSALNKTFSELFLINTLTAIISTIVYLTAIFLVEDLQIRSSFTYICLALILFTPLNIDWLFSGLEKFKIITIRAVFIKAIALVLLFLFVKTKEDVAVYLAILVFSYIGNYLLNLALLKKNVSFTFKGISLKKHRKPLFYILSTTFATTIYTSLDSVVLGILTNDLEVGLYTAGVKLSKVSIPIVTGLSAVLVPRIAQAIKDKNVAHERDMINRSFSFIVFLGIPISAGLFIFRETFVLIFSGQDYLGAISAMGYLSFLPFFVGLGYLFGFQVLVPNNLNRTLFSSTLAGVLAFVVFNFLFTKNLGADGAALSILCTEIVVTGAYFLYTPKILRKDLPMREVIFALLSCISFIPIYYLLGLNSLSLEIKLGLAVLLCGSSYAILQYYVFKNSIVTTIINTIQSKLL